MRQGNRPGTGQRVHRGTVNRWRPGEGYGFISGDDGSTWFASRSGAEPVDDVVTEGTEVTFTGSLVPPPGKRYPNALNVRAAPPPPGGAVSAAPGRPRD